jgi:hypothetical protein
VALIVVACGCRVVSALGVDAATAPGDGLPSRIVTDAALWSDVRNPDLPYGHSNADAGGPSGDRASIDADVSPADAPYEIGSLDLVSRETCSLLDDTCVGLESCYPLPYEGTPNGATVCALSGIAGPSMPCQSQLDCDGTTLCSAPQTEPDSVCLRRCSLVGSACPTGTHCLPFFDFSGVGVCM